MAIFELSIRSRSEGGNWTDKPDPTYPSRQVEVATDELLREAIWDYFWDLDFRWNLPVGGATDALLVTDIGNGGILLEEPPIEQPSDPPLGYS